ncbi:hypothetical protein pben1_p15 [Paracoccus phage vB_PbeS_Pben1]|nr:hypothetical protein pben1_p15 [Paracoccus phage vB_PbeS_Pben1]
MPIRSEIVGGLRSFVELGVPGCFRRTLTGWPLWLELPPSLPCPGRPAPFLSHRARRFRALHRRNA